MKGIEKALLIGLLIAVACIIIVLFILGSLSVSTKAEKTKLSFSQICLIWIGYHCEFTDITDKQGKTIKVEEILGACAEARGVPVGSDCEFKKQCRAMCLSCPPLECP